MTEYAPIDLSDSAVDALFTDYPTSDFDLTFDENFEQEFSVLDSDAPFSFVAAVAAAPVSQVGEEVGTLPEWESSDIQMLDELTAFLESHGEADATPSAEDNMVYPEPCQPDAVPDLIPAPLFAAPAAPLPLFNGAVPFYNGVPQYPPPGYSVVWYPAPLFSGPQRALNNKGPAPAQYGATLTPMPMHPMPYHAYPPPAAVPQPATTSSLPELNFNPIDFIDGSDTPQSAEVSNATGVYGGILSNDRDHEGYLLRSSKLNPAQEAEMAEKRAANEATRRRRAGLGPVADPAREEEEERIMVAHDVAFYENRRLARRARQERRRRERQDRDSPETDREMIRPRRSRSRREPSSPLVSRRALPVLVQNPFPAGYAPALQAAPPPNAWMVPSVQPPHPPHRLPQVRRVEARQRLTANAEQWRQAAQT